MTICICTLLCTEALRNCRKPLYNGSLSTWNIGNAVDEEGEDGKLEDEDFGCEGDGRREFWEDVIDDGSDEGNSGSDGDENDFINRLVWCRLFCLFVCLFI